MVSNRSVQPPRLAILIPIFRHSALLIEAIESALAQKIERGVRLILVNDGCPFPETDDVCKDYQSAYPNVVTYLRKKNGGLSDARNFGIRYILEHLTSVEAIYLLDADNKLRPDSMARALAALDQNPDVDWIYPDIDMFGLEWQGNYGGDFSTLILTEMNICEAGSLIRRSLFESGVFFDTSFKLGWEDWDFFVTAAESGFRGKNIENFGFLYRKRPESMLADSDRDSNALSGAMQLKHKSLVKPRRLVKLEQNEAPRYAIHLVDTAEILYCVDPEDECVKKLTFKEYEVDFWCASISSPVYRTPPFTLVTTSEVLGSLRDAGLLHWALWKLETMLQSNGLAALSVKKGSSERLSISQIEHANRTGEHRTACVVALTSKLLTEIAQDTSSSWIESLQREVADPPLHLLQISLPAKSRILPHFRRQSATFDLLAFIGRVRASRWRDSSFRKWGFRVNGIPLRSQEHEIVRRRCGGAPVFPKVVNGAKHIGFLLPLVEFGGVEKVALQIAASLKSLGWVPHAFVLEAQSASMSDVWSDVFATTNILADSNFSTWHGGSKQYFGTNVPAWAEQGQHGTMVAMLHWLDAVINFHGGAAAGAMGQLRRMGIKTVNSLHLNDLTQFGRPVGNAYLGLAYEHAFDYFAPCSQQLADWLHSMGVPRDKIITVPNAPGFNVAPSVTARGIAARYARTPHQPLNVLYIGRLDRQKGIDRLRRVIRDTNHLKMNVKWRLIGKTVVPEGMPPLGSELDTLVEPPVSRPAQLADLYAWADVLVLLSSYEGLPLTILEAMRAGVVVIATDVGAVSEVLQNGRNGILLKLERSVEGCLDALRRLSCDRQLLMSLSERAVHDSAGREWGAAVSELNTVLS